MIPWVLSAAMDACSMRLHAVAMSADERNEMTRRQYLLFLYCVRTPIYESIFRQHLSPSYSHDAVCGLIGQCDRPVYMFFFNRLWRRIPVIREIAGLVHETTSHVNSMVLTSDVFSSETFMGLFDGLHSLHFCDCFHKFSLGHVVSRPCLWNLLMMTLPIQ